MSTSDSNHSRQKNRQAFHAALVYFLLTLFCGVFSYIYELFSHGVYSSYMVSLFVFPLVGGVIPFGLLWLTGGRHYPGRFTVNAYNSGIAVLTVGSCLQGVLEIYGTTSVYIPVYWIVGGILAGTGILTFSCTLTFPRRR